MTQVFQKDFRGKVFWILFLLFVLIIPISQIYGVRILLVVLLFSFFTEDLKESLRRFLSLSWDALIFLLIISFGLLYTERLDTGLRVIETALSLMVLPILFSRVRNFSKEHLHKIFYAFATGLFIASLICLLNASNSYATDRNVDVFVFDKFTEVLDSHPTYMAYYLIAAITFGLYMLYYEKISSSPWLLVALLIFFFLVLLLTGGITAFVSMLFILAFFVLKYMLEEKNKRHTLTFSVVVLMIASMFTFIAVNRNKEVTSRRDDSWERLALWESAIKANPNVVWGVGTGDYRTVLNEYYNSHNLSRFADVNFNPHNQFLETYISNGLLGLFCLLILLGRPIYLSVHNSNVLGTLIFFPFIIYGMTEVFLGRYQGVVFFALMHQSFIAYYKSYTPSFPLKDA